MGATKHWRRGTTVAVLHTAVSAIKRAAGAVAGLLPQPPSTDPERPDIDGKRRADLDREDLIRVRTAEKQGKGGYR
jgi:hypothetical protein